MGQEADPHADHHREDTEVGRRVWEGRRSSVYSLHAASYRGACSILVKEPMRRPIFAVVFAAIALLSACAQPSSSVSVSKQAGAIACDSFIKAGSALAAEIGAYTEKPACERKYHPGGAGYAETLSLGAFHRTDDGKGQIWSVIMRAYGDLGGQRPGFDEQTLQGDRNFRHLADVTPTGLPGNAGPARVSTFDIGNMGLACVDALTDNKDGSHTVVSLCRSTAIDATDAERFALAQSIAANDLPGITP